MKIRINNEDEYIDIIEEYGKCNVTKWEDKNFALASERAFDTMAICGIRERPSRGKFSEKRIYTAPNKDRICIYRPKINDNYISDSYEEITQNDLDVLRAVNTKYIEEYIEFKFNKSVESTQFSISSLNKNLAIMLGNELLKLLDEKIAIVITGDEIRKRLKRSISTSEIIYSLNKISSLSLIGDYRVCHKDVTRGVAITGNLFDFITLKGKNNNSRKILICLIFNTNWGQLYLHNIRFGNISWINDEKYLKLNNTAKNIIVTVMAFKNRKFIRKANDLLSILNIKISKNRERAIRLLDKNLNELMHKGLIIWTKINDTYHIEHKLNPLKVSDSNTIMKYQELDKEDGEILNIAKHYDMLARRYNNTVQYYSLSIKNPKEHSNWWHFESLFYLCDENKWDVKIYLEAQFDRAKHWENQNVKYPLPKMLLSENAQSYYIKYIKKIKENYRIPENKKLKASDTVGIKEEINKEILRSIESLKSSLSNRGNKQSSSESEYKLNYIYNHWETISPYYLWSVEWFHQFLHEIKKNSNKFSKWEEKVIRYFDKIQQVKDIQFYIIQSVKELEKSYKIPPNIDIKDIIQN